MLEHNGEYFLNDIGLYGKVLDETSRSYIYPKNFDQPDTFTARYAQRYFPYEIRAKFGAEGTLRFKKGLQFRIQL